MRRGRGAQEERSKFGVALTAAGEAAVVQSFRRFGWLQGLHVHVGSQGCSLAQLAQGARRAAHLARRLEQVASRTPALLKAASRGLVSRPKRRG